MTTGPAPDTPAGGTPEEPKPGGFLRRSLRTGQGALALVIAWNLFDVLVHVAVDLFEAPRIVGNVGALVAAAVALAVLRTSGDRRIAAAATAAGIGVVLGGNAAYLVAGAAFLLIPSLVFIGVSLALQGTALVRLRDTASVDSAEDAAARQRLIAAGVGLLVVGALGGFLVGDQEPPELDYTDLALHAGYWIEDEGPALAVYDDRPMISHSVHHVDVATRSISVYAQAFVTEGVDGTGEEVVVSPPQLEPGECGTDPINGRAVCAHANAVYLNGSGEELDESDGSGSWWVKHAWIVDGEGYNNCEMLPPPAQLLDYDEDCRPVIGTWQDDELTMHVGLEGPANSVVLFYNQRTPLVDRSPAVYRVQRVDPRPGVDAWTLTSDCVPDRPSPFDGSTLGCPNA